MKNCDRGLENAFSSPRSQFFAIRTDPKLVNNLLIFPAINWLTSGFTQLCH